MSLGPRPSPKDLIVGVGVALILIPRSMAYGELAGLPARHGLVRHLDGLGRIDLTGAQALRELMEQLREGGLDV